MLKSSPYYKMFSTYNQDYNKSQYHRDRIQLNKYISEKSKNKYSDIQPIWTTKEEKTQVLSEFPKFVLKTGLNTNIINSQVLELPEICILDTNTELTYDHLYIGRFLVVSDCMKIYLQTTLSKNIVLEFINISDNTIIFQNSNDNRIYEIKPLTTVFILIE